MKKILLPFDYSELSLNALKYAMSMQELEIGEVVVFHVENQILDANISVQKELPEFGKKSRTAPLITYVETNLAIDSSLPFKLSFKVAGGNPVSAITKESERGGYDLIVMGTRNQYDFFDKWLGTITLGVAKTSKIPLLIIPNYISYQAYERILVACDHHIRKTGVLEAIKSWNQYFKAYVRFYHVSKKNEHSFPIESVDIVKHYFEKEEVEFGFEIVNKPSKDIAATIINAAYKTASDLILLVPENQKFWSTILFKSVSKELILKSNLPVLFIHS